jgi:hypothetical protein
VRKLLAIGGALSCLFAVAPDALAAGLSERSAAHALRSNLARGYGIRHVHVACVRRSSSKLSCRWRGSRSGTGYRGRAVVSRSGGATLVQLSGVHRT